MQTSYVINYVTSSKLPINISISKEVQTIRGTLDEINKHISFPYTLSKDLTRSKLNFDFGSYHGWFLQKKIYFYQRLMFGVPSTQSRFKWSMSTFSHIRFKIR